ncbi:MAG: leucyl/phenylalanyl-tRNA--protein transferase [Granulosicoccaceae bacterium]
MQLPFLPPDAPLAFPDPSQALQDPDGLLCAGADLSHARLLLAYRTGIFPWFNEGDPILWWSPSTRCVLPPESMRINRSLRKVINRGEFEVRWDTAFSDVIAACAAPREGAPGTWINTDMEQAYTLLHALGHAHSVECWQDEELVGGLYGVSIGPCFFGESMFSRRSNASKVALANLCQSGRYQLIDCQMPTEHLLGLGAQTMPREGFLTLLAELLEIKPNS